MDWHNASNPTDGYTVFEKENTEPSVAHQAEDQPMLGKAMYEVPGEHQPLSARGRLKILGAQQATHGGGASKLFTTSSRQFFYPTTPQERLICDNLRVKT